MIFRRSSFASKSGIKSSILAYFGNTQKQFSFLFVLLCLLPSSLLGQAKTSEDIQINAEVVSTDTAQVTLKLQAGGVGNVTVRLNGKDVTSRFSPSSCAGATCRTATLTAADGLVAAKDVVTVITDSGKTGRLRFSLTGVAQHSLSGAQPLLEATSATVGAVLPKAQGLGTSYATSLPPTVAFTTNTPGGWSSGSTWVTINGVGYPDVTPNGTCGGSLFLAIVLDRQTLQEKTSAPESSPMCLTNSAAVSSYLSSLSANDLVVVGSNSGVSPDTGLNLSAIGGSGYGGGPGGVYYPQSIIAIGTPGATGGTAYEGYESSSPNYPKYGAFATGTLQEDAYGDYNFESSEVREFTVSPNDQGTLTAGGGTSAIAISIPRPAPNSPTEYVYSAPTGTNGYWLLTLSRVDLTTSGFSCPWGSVSSDGTAQYIPNCGTFYPTGSSDPTTSFNAYYNLAIALNSINSWEVVFLTTIGQASAGSSSWTVGGFTVYNQQSAGNGWYPFSQALQGLGGTPNLTLSLLSPTSSYTFIGGLGFGGPLGGMDVESSTVLSAQGQTGFVHGTLQRNLNGLYMPSQANQDTPAVYLSKGGARDPEFAFKEIALQQPVDWPSSSQTTLLNAPPWTADTIAGQVAAYQYLSYVLLTKIYLPNIPVTDPHLTDIHYFFTGSYATSINYHYYDVAQMQWPGIATGPYVVPCMGGGPATSCTVALTSETTVTFSENDFSAAQTQLSQEIRYLTDTLQYLVTGTESLKSIVAGGSAGAGAALTGAAATILGSQLVPTVNAQTHVQASWQSIVTMVGGVASVIPVIGSTVSNASKLVTTLSSMTTVIGQVTALSAGAGSATASTKSLPSAFARFDALVGDIANGTLQDQIGIGYDTLSDSILSDWGRLSKIGSMAVDPSNPAFYSPTQLAQTTAVNALTQAASRSFYLSLMPSFYTVQYWQGVSGDWQNPGNNIPDMGGYYTGSGRAQYCSAFYLAPQQNTVEQQNETYTGLGTISSNVSVYYPSPAGTPQNFSKDYSGSPIDYYVIADSKAGVKGFGSAEAVIPVISANLGAQLFTSTGLNMPIDEFVTPGGPMGGVFENGASAPPSGLSGSSLCNARLYPYGYGSLPTQPTGVNGGTGLGVSLSAGAPLSATVTTLTSPASATEGAGAVLTAHVTSNGTPVTTGSVFFQMDGTFKSQVNLDATGAATITWGDLALGQHTVKALYSRVDPYDVSSSDPATITIYSSAPDLAMSASSSTLQVSYGKISSAVNLQVSSVGGMAGTVNFTCSGLPIGMTCNFNPAQVALAAGGQATASFTISGSTSQTNSASLWIPGIGLVLLPVSLAGLYRFRNRTTCTGTLLSVLLLLAATSLTGCSGGSSSSQSTTVQESGTKTVIVNATSGGVTRTIPIQVTIQ